MLRLSILGGVVSTLAYLLLSGPVSAVAISLLAGITSMIAMVATMSLAAELCPAGAEGFAFAAMMSILNIAGPLADLSGSMLDEHVFDRHFAPLVVASAGGDGAGVLPDFADGDASRAGFRVGHIEIRVFQRATENVITKS